MFKKSMGSVVAALAATVLVSACGGGGGSSGGGGVIYDPGYQAWYDVYGFRCGTGGPSPGCNFYANGFKIGDIEDPYFDSFYALEYARYFYTDSYGFSSTYEGFAWLSPNGILYDYYGDALNDDSGTGRDLAGDVAQLEQNIVRTAADHLAEKYDLEPKVAMEIATVTHDYNQIGKSRARTEADFADFSQRLYGQDLNEIKAALGESMKGNKAPVNGMVQELATTWSTSPENVKTIIKNWYGKEAGQLL